MHELTSSEKATRTPGTRTVALLSAAALAAAGVAVSTIGGHAAGAATPPVGQTATSIGTSSDSYTNSSAPSSNYGTGTKLLVGDVGGAVDSSYVKFSIPAAAVGRVTSAQLVLTRTNHHLSTPISLYPVADTTWNDSTLTSANAPAAGALLTTVPTSSATSTVSYDVTKQATTATVSFKIASSATTDVAQFASSATASGPRLNLTYTTGCALSALLVPACGVLFGSAPRVLMPSPPPLAQAVADDEAMSGRSMDIVHEYHTNAQLFPTPTEVSVAETPGDNHLLLENWKPSTSDSWAAVAAGADDARIDTESAYILANYDKPFFLTIFHEPENDVNATIGSGWTAKDYAAMFRHVILRMRADGVTKAVTVMDYMGFAPWTQQSWFADLYPGDDVVDWNAIDPYEKQDASGYLVGPFDTTMMNKTATGFPGFYNYLTTLHPTKPIMLGEWGVFTTSTSASAAPMGKANLYASAEAQIAAGEFPMLKAMVYFDVPIPPPGIRGNTSPDSDPNALAAWKKLANDPAIVGPIIHA